MLQKIILSVVLFVCSAQVIAQNFIPNGGFENYTKIPVTLGNFYVTNWAPINPSYNSPDLFSNAAFKNDIANPLWHFSQVKPLEGASFAGIILESGEHDYREPIINRLITKLREDSSYLFKISVAIPYMSNYTISTLDVVFSPYPLMDWENVKLEDYPTRFSIPLDSVKQDFSWFTYTYEFIGTGNENYISIGNFKSAKESKLTKIENRNDPAFKKLYNQAYVAIDDVQLYDIALLKKEEIETTIEEPAEIDIKESITLENLLFEVGSSILSNEEIPELDKIAAYLFSNDQISIRITGHTDNSGNEEDNRTLSLNRANSVASYLILAGVSEDRITTEGLGSVNPISTNDTEEGRAQNRRVIIEFSNQ